MYLIDTNVISEFRKGRRANAGVVAFFGAVDSKTLFLPAQVVGEIQAGIAKLRRQGSGQALRQADAYELWLDSLISEFGDRVLEFDIEAARTWGMFLSNEKKDPHTIDKQIAAIALIHGLTVVTRDGGEAFKHMPNVKSFNPFTDAPVADSPRRRH
ncbi:type II toxin-antitoxin system VapC family toxin [Pseudoduganella ginsengisoli]|uniref:PIN domain-containing protein n=1 Tax=Pseudoduganella ginsengisoli TaxID=1462440 RepID=A0A6L6Q3F1_9BURK|nr:type II toxin-antitoxin system VapC family toxin [Pseudoduganella ginsengisoli]MTW03974.1 PIN domain-containing protein [Pseudoduganella ginsengisoli]